MAERMLRLYRGLSANEFSPATEKVFKKNKSVWHLILERRLSGDFEYPHDLDKEIVQLQKTLRLEHQYFTDSKAIAESYARKVGGLLVEIKVPIKDLYKHINIEFQNFGRRKKQFEIVYCVRGSLLVKYSKKWQLKVRRKR